MSTVLRLHRLPVVDFGHPPDPPAPQSRVLVAVPPAVDGSLDESSLASQARIQLRQCPSNGVALGLVVQAVTFVRVLGAAGTWIYAVLRLEVLGKILNVDRFNVAADGVLHLHAITRVLESNPLDAVRVLPDHQRSRRWNGTWSSVGVYV